MTMADLLSRKAEAVSVKTTLEHFEKQRFLKYSFLLAAVDELHRHSCFQKLAESRKPGLE